MSSKRSGKRLMSMRTRILAVFLTVFLVVIVSITIIFNVLVNNYIARTAVNRPPAMAIMMRYAPPLHRGLDGNPARDLMNFARGVNMFLVIIMVVAVIITFLVTVLITRRMTRPLADLTAFSARIGRGDFTPCTEDFHDRELATLAESMNHAAAQLDSYDKDQKTFFQNASHELRTPLMSIKCYAEGIAYDVMDAKPASATILTETDRLSEMVEDLLTVSRIDNITQDQRFAACDLRELLSAAVDEQRAVAERDHLELIFDFDEFPVVIWANDKTLQRAFSNLISNALRYATSTVTMGCRQEGSQARVTVTDDGSGIAAADLPHIFERFYHGEGGKHGIGLAIVKSVVEQHGGALEVRTDATRTSFILVFESIDPAQSLTLE